MKQTRRAPGTRASPLGNYETRRARRPGRQLQGADRLNGVIVELEAMKKGSPRQPSELGPQLQARIAEAQQTVSDQAAKLSRSVANLADIDDRVRGWIWIGDSGAAALRPGAVQN